MTSPSALDHLWNARKTLWAAIGAAATAFAAIVSALPAGAGLNAITVQGWTTIVLAALSTTGLVYSVSNRPLPVAVDALPDLAPVLVPVVTVTAPDLPDLSTDVSAAPESLPDLSAVA